MATSMGPGNPRRASKKPASGSEPASENTQGLVIPKTSPNAPGAPTNPPVKAETPEEKSLLQKAGELLEKGEIPILNDAKEGIKGLIDGVAGTSTAGAIAKGAVEILFPTNVIDIIPGGKVLSGGKKAAKLGEEALKTAGKAAAKETSEKAAKEAAEKAAKEAADKEAKVAKGSDGAYSKKTKRRPKRRCELVPYDELDCGPGQQAHHVVPDWMLRLGPRGGPERIPGLPSLESGPAICLEGSPGGEHQSTHRHIDRPAERIARSGRSTGVPGTLKLGQAKIISARAIEKATGGAKGGGCDRKDIQDQLDEKFKAHNDTLVRGVKDSRQITDEIRNATTRPTGD